jgi:hypothetical protein
MNALGTNHHQPAEAPAPSCRTPSGIRRSITPAPISRPMQPWEAGLSFLEGIACKRLCPHTLESWVEHNLVLPGYVPKPTRLHEPLFGALPTDKGCSPFLPEMPPSDETSALLIRARARIVGQLRGLIRTPPEDRFLHAAIFAGRVRRAPAGATMAWLPSPRSGDALSDIITSLFVSDILGRREFYKENLCICHSCGRVRLDASSTERDKCFFC